MTAKEKQKNFIKNYLKPTLKQAGYSTQGQTWWMAENEFFKIINLQNYSWNSQDSVDFRFNIGIGLTATMKDPEKKKATYNDLTVHVTEHYHLPRTRQKHRFLNNQGYSITTSTNLEDFTNELQKDFELGIIPALNGLTTLEDCLNFYKGADFWYEQLKRQLAELKDGK